MGDAMVKDVEDRNGRDRPNQKTPSGWTWLCIRVRHVGGDSCTSNLTLVEVVDHQLLLHVGVST